MDLEQRVARIETIFRLLAATLVYPELDSLRAKLGIENNPTYMDKEDAEKNINNLTGLLGQLDTEEMTRYLKNNKQS
jgi:hypothetical protein